MKTFLTTITLALFFFAGAKAFVGENPKTAPDTLKSGKTVEAKADTMKKEVKETKEAQETKPAETPQDKGIGPIKEMKPGPLDQNLASTGQTLFKANCVVCHELDKKKVGPPLRDVTVRRTPEYVMNMILNFAEMEKKDPEVKKLIKEYNAYMSVQTLTQDQARALLEYLRSAATEEKPK